MGTAGMNSWKIGGSAPLCRFLWECTRSPQGTPATGVEPSPPHRSGFTPSKLVQAGGADPSKYRLLSTN